MPNFSILVEWEGVIFRVTGTYHFVPENRRGHPDTWTPEEFEVNAEGAEFAGTGAPTMYVLALLDFQRAVEEEVMAIISSRT